MAVLYKGGKATAAEEEPSLLETVENNLGITDRLRDEGHDCRGMHRNARADWTRFNVTEHKQGHENFFQRNIADHRPTSSSQLHSIPHILPPSYLPKPRTSSFVSRRMKRGAWLVNTARGANCVAEDVADALASGQLIGYAGIQPAPRGHPWRTMKTPRVRTTLFAVNVMILRFDRRVGGGNGILPHMSGTTLDPQYRHAVGTQEILRRWVAGQKQEPQNLIVKNGELGV
ncbi:LOW QUALITY PROTEIN: Formate dehydrogenase [Saitozyma sp. JCM 24511]|nr:LOW QUALITY PROTEIN: Formate dehydrogenase [Saitozyma sp. JCM 24511]